MNNQKCEICGKDMECIVGDYWSCPSKCDTKETGPKIVYNTKCNGVEIKLKKSGHYLVGGWPTLNAGEVSIGWGTFEAPELTRSEVETMIAETEKRIMESLRVPSHLLANHPNEDVQEYEVIMSNITSVDIGEESVQVWDPNYNYYDVLISKITKTIPTNLNGKKLIKYTHNGMYEII